MIPRRRSALPSFVSDLVSDRPGILSVLGSVSILVAVECRSLKESRLDATLKSTKFQKEKNVHRKATECSTTRIEQSKIY